MNRPFHLRLMKIYIQNLNKNAMGMDWNCIKLKNMMIIDDYDCFRDYVSLQYGIYSVN